MTTRTSRDKDVSWKIRRFRPADLPQIISLLEICFKEDLTDEKRTIEHWKWEFVDVPKGPSEIFVAEDNGKVVGHYGCTPMILSTSTSLIDARLVVDVMTHPDYQQQGMFTALGHYSMNNLRQLGSPLALGFPATGRKKQVMPGHLKVGWFPICDMPVLGRPLNANRVARVKFSNRVLAKFAEWGLSFFYRVIRPWKLTSSISNISIRKIEKPDSRFDELWKRIQIQYDIIQRRDNQFVNWRFFNCPHREYHVFIVETNDSLTGYAVVRFFEQSDLNGALIIDFVTDRNCRVERELLLDEIYHFSRKSGADIIASLIHDSQSLDLLKLKGFMKTGEVYTLIAHLHDVSLKNHEISDTTKWFLTWADFDVL